MTEISEYSFNNLNIGLKKFFSVKVTEQMVDDFAKLSGDYNPLHMDENYCLKTEFKQRICHGMLLSSFFSTLVGMYLPGKNSLYFSQSLNFHAPCFINDEITIEGEITEKHESLKLVRLKTTIFNKKRKRIVSGYAKVVIRD